jgi:hypothetical protein
LTLRGDPYDLVLSKLGLNSPVDREDVAHLARTALLDPDLLRTRYADENSPTVANARGRSPLWVSRMVLLYPWTDRAVPDHSKRLPGADS